MANNTTLSNKMIAALNAQAEKLGIPVEEIIRNVEEYIQDFCQLDEFAAKKALIQLQYTAPAPKEETAEAEQTTETSSSEATVEADQATEETAEATAEADQATEENTEAEQEKPKKRIWTLEKLLSDSGIAEVGVENVTKLCKEMRAAYRNKYPKCWLKATKPSDFPNDLRKAFKDDITILSLIKDKCRGAAKFDEATRCNIIRLTTSDMPTKRFGGLRALWFPVCVCDYLKDHANIIGEYFKTFIHEEDGGNRLPIPKGIEFPKEAPVDPKAEKQPKSDKEVAEAAQTTENQDVAETPVAEAAEKTVAIPTKPTKKLDTHKVINRMGDVRSFLFLADKLRKAGIDPEALLEKEEGVNAMINNMVKAMGEI